LVAGIAVVMTWSMAIARYGGPDEPAHVVRAFAVADGQGRGEPSATLPVGYRIVEVPASLASGDPACFRHDPTITPDCAVVLPTASGNAPPAMVRVATSAGINPPLYYALVGVPVRVLGERGDPTSYRTVAALLNACVLAMAAWRARRLLDRDGPTHRIGLVMMLAGLTPATWFLFGVVNPNGFEIALAALAWVGVVRMWRSPTPSFAELAWVGVPIGLAVAVRPIALATALPMLAIIELRQTGRLRRHQRTIVWVPVLLALGSLVVWQQFLGINDATDPRTARSGSLLTALGRSVSGLPTTIRELIGSLGWLEYSAPVVAQALWGLTLCAAAAAWVAQVRRTSRHRPSRSVRLWPVWAIWAGALVLTPLLFEVVFFTRLGPIWQGRYSLPMWLGVGALMMITTNEQASEPVDEAARVPAAEPPSGRWAGIIASAVLAVGVSETLTFWAVLRRSTVGSNGSWWFADAHSTNDARWLLIVHALTVAGLTAAALRTALQANRLDSTTGPSRPREPPNQPGYA